MIGRTIVLTSGTTGAPKGASRRDTAALGPGVAMLDRIPYRGSETMVVAAPMFHSWGFGNFTIALVLGDTLVLQRRFDPEETLAAIERHIAAEVLAAVPVMLQRILELPRGGVRPLRRRRRCASSRCRAQRLPGGLAPALDAAVRRRTSTTSTARPRSGTRPSRPPTTSAPAPGTAGRPPPAPSVKVLDDDGHEVPRRPRRGRIFVRSQLLFDGYTGGGSKPMVDGLMSTGDTGHFDDHGRLFVEGRDDEMIVSGGENVFPREVEDLLSVARRRASKPRSIGVPDEEFGQRLKAFVVRATGPTVTADELRDYVKTTSRASRCRATSSSSTSYRATRRARC